jgi:hypothetical protein
MSEVGYLLATRDSWKVTVDDDVRALVYHWAGGVPRLLRLAHMPLDATVFTCVWEPLRVSAVRRAVQATV